jgi:hypothetical protein
MTAIGPGRGETKTAVSISEMARMAGLSRQRFHQLVKDGVFPSPLREGATGRPYYDEPAQERCLEVRRRNCGINGRIVLFYSRRLRPSATPEPNPQPTKIQHPRSEGHAEILDGVRALGLPATAAMVHSVVKELFPKGTGKTDPGEVIRAVFVRLKRKNPAEKVRRKE